MGEEIQPLSKRQHTVEHADSFTTRCLCPSISRSKKNCSAAADKTRKGRGQEMRVGAVFSFDNHSPFKCCAGAQPMNPERILRG
jgi:hypothetical protein